MNSQQDRSLDAVLEQLFRVDSPPPPRPDLAKRVIERIRRRELSRRSLILVSALVGLVVSIPPLIEIGSGLTAWLPAALDSLGSAGLLGVKDSQAMWLVVAVLAALAGPLLHALIEQ